MERLGDAEEGLAVPRGPHPRPAPPAGPLRVVVGLPPAPPHPAPRLPAATFSIYRPPPPAARGPAASLPLPTRMPGHATLIPSSGGVPARQVVEVAPDSPPAQMETGPAAPAAPSVGDPGDHPSLSLEPLAAIPSDAGDATLSTEDPASIPPAPSLPGRHVSLSPPPSLPPLSPISAAATTTTAGPPSHCPPTPPRMVSFASPSADTPRGPRPQPGHSSPGPAAAAPRPWSATWKGKERAGRDWSRLSDEESSEMSGSQPGGPGGPSPRRCRGHRMRVPHPVPAAVPPDVANDKAVAAVEAPAPPTPAPPPDGSLGNAPSSPLRLYIHGVDRLEPNLVVCHPYVRVHVLDSWTGLPLPMPQPPVDPPPDPSSLAASSACPGGAEESPAPLPDAPAQDNRPPPAGAFPASFAPTVPALTTPPYDLRGHRTYRPAWEAELLLPFCPEDWFPAVSPGGPPAAPNAPSPPAEGPPRQPPVLLLLELMEFDAPDLPLGQRIWTLDGQLPLAWASLNLADPRWGRSVLNRRLDLPLFHFPQNRNCLHRLLSPLWSWWYNRPDEHDRHRAQAFWQMRWQVLQATRRPPWPSPLAREGGPIAHIPSAPMVFLVFMQRYNRLVGNRYGGRLSITLATAPLAVTDPAPPPTDAVQPTSAGPQFPTLSDMSRFAPVSEDTSLVERPPRLGGQRCELPDKLWRELPAGGRGCAALQFSSDGRFLAVACREAAASYLRVVSMADTSAIFEAEAHKGHVHSVAFSPSNPRRLLTCASDHTAKLWVVRDGSPTGGVEVAPLDTQASVDPEAAHPCSVVSTPRLSKGKPSKKRKKSGTEDHAAGLVCSVALPHPSYVYCAVFHPSRRVVVTGCFDGDIRLWSQRTGVLQQRLAAHQGWVVSLALGERGAALYSLDGRGQVLVWGHSPRQQTGLALAPGKRAKGRAALSFRCTLASLPDSGACRLQAVPSGLLVLCWRDHAIVHLDVVSGGELRRYVGCEFSLDFHCLTVSPDGRLLLAVGASGVPHWWELGGGPGPRPAASLPLCAAAGLCCVAWSPAEHVVAGGTTGDAATAGRLFLWTHCSASRRPFNTTAAPSSCALTVPSPGPPSPSACPSYAPPTTMPTGLNLGPAARLQQLVEHWQRLVWEREVERGWATVARVQGALASLRHAHRAVAPGAAPGPSPEQWV